MHQGKRGKYIKALIFFYSYSGSLLNSLKQSPKLSRRQIKVEYKKYTLSRFKKSVVLLETTPL